MILISRKQMASVSLGIDIVETLAPIPYVTFVLPSDHHSQSRDWYDVCVGNRLVECGPRSATAKFLP